MGNTPTVLLNWDAPHPRTAEGAQERINTLVAFLLERFYTYSNEAANFFALNDEQFELEQFYYLIVWNDVAVTNHRFGQASIQADLLFKLETLRLLMGMSFGKQALAKYQRRIVGGVAVGGTVGLTLAAGIVPLALAGAGFTASGVAAGSLAAGAQSAFYGAYTTGFFSLCQSVGAIGLSAGATTGVTAIGLTVGGVVGGLPSLGSPCREGETPAKMHVDPNYSWESGKTIEELWKEYRVSKREHHRADETAGAGGARREHGHTGEAEESEDSTRGVD